MNSGSIKSAVLNSAHLRRTLLFLVAQKGHCFRIGYASDSVLGKATRHVLNAPAHLIQFFSWFAASLSSLNSGSTTSLVCIWDITMQKRA